MDTKIEKHLKSLSVIEFSTWIASLPESKYNEISKGGIINFANYYIDNILN